MRYSVYIYQRYIFGKYRNYFHKHLKEKINCQRFISLSDVLKRIILDLKIEKSQDHKTILFSPSGASFDRYKNFEDRGNKFNILVKKLKIISILNAQ